MPDGEMRRPPQLWEQRLARTTSILGVGVSQGGATSIVPPTPPPTDGGPEPTPGQPPPGTFKKPSTPLLIGGIQGITVLWDGLNADGDLWPYDTSFIEVHMDTSGTAFTPGTATLRGRLSRPGSYFVGGLTAGTTYHFRFQGVDLSENRTEPSDAASGQTGQTIQGDLGNSSVGPGQISFDARQIGGVTNSVQATAPSDPLQGDVWLDTSPGTAVIHKIWNGSSWVTNAWGSASIAAGQITALQLAAGAVTAGAITAGTVNGWYIQGGTISGNQIIGGTITGGYISGGTMNAGFISGGTISAPYLTTGPSNERRVILGDVGETDVVKFNAASSSTKFLLGMNSDNTNLGLSTTGAGKFLVVPELEAQNAFRAGANAFRVSSGGEVFSTGIDDNTTANAANVRVGASAQLLKSTSTVRLKDELAPLDDHLADVPAEKLTAEPPSVDPYDVLTLTPTEFRSLSPADADARSLGFIAEDVAAKFPWAANWDDEGLPSAVEDRPIIAALVAVIQDLRARIEALEA